MNIEKHIAEKEAALTEVKRVTAILEQQIAALRAAAVAAEPTEFEKMLVKKQPTEETGKAIFATSHNQIFEPVKIVPHGTIKPISELDIASKFVQRVRNPKGLTEKIARTVLAPVNQNLDELEIAINERAEKPVSRAAVRNHMMKLKNDGYAVSDGPGVFRLASKSEAATDSQSVAASGASKSFQDMS